MPVDEPALFPSDGLPNDGFPRDGFPNDGQPRMPLSLLLGPLSKMTVGFGVNLRDHEPLLAAPLDVVPEAPDPAVVFELPVVC